MVKKLIKKATSKKTSLDVDTSIDGIKKFVAFTKEFNVASITVGSKGKSITIKKTPSAPAAATPAPIKETAPAYVPESYEKIKSHYIGSFHAVKGVAAGSKVKKGQPVANIYSMGIEHAVSAEKECTIKEVLVTENQLVDYGKPLFIIE